MTLGNDMPIDRYYQALWRGHIQVSTATHESLGVATLEARATNNYCLLPRIGSYSEIAEHDSTVFYDDVIDFTARLMRLVHNINDEVVARRNQFVRSQYSPRSGRCHSPRSSLRGMPVTCCPPLFRLLLFRARRQVQEFLQQATQAVFRTVDQRDICLPLEDDRSCRRSERPAL